MVSREQFIYHMDKIRAYDKLQQQIDSLTGRIGRINAAESGSANIDLYPMVLEMMNMLDDCLDTPYVDTIDWTMARKSKDEVYANGFSECMVRLIEAWGTEMEYGENGPIEIFDQDNGIYVHFSSTDDLYDYLFVSQVV